MEAQTTDDVDIAIGMNELQDLFDKYKIKPRKVKNPPKFDMFYNEYTKIYPLAGGLSKTAHIKQILKEGESKNIDGIARVIEFLKNPDPKVKFLDANFCGGGCIGGPLLTPNKTLDEKKKRVLDYVQKAVHEKIPKGEKGVLDKAKGIKVSY
jgi:iron only hydrogenase large subunit-like protein